MANPEGSVAQSAAASTAPILPDVIGQHLEELAFLSIQRRKLLFAEDVSLTAFLRHEERMAAHWDGLAVGGPASIRLALERLEEFDPWESYAAARVWLDLASPTGPEVAARLAETEPELHGTWLEALRRIPAARLTQLFPVGTAARYSPKILWVVVDAWGWHGALDERVAMDACSSPDPLVRRAVARTFGWIPAVAQSRGVVPVLARDPDPNVYRRAVWSIALSNPAAALAHCRQRATAGEADAYILRVLALLGGPEDADLLQPLAGTPDERWMPGDRFPWRGSPDEEPMESRWRSVARVSRPEFAWLRREVPDGFFDVEPREDAVPGE